MGVITPDCPEMCRSWPKSQGHAALSFLMFAGAMIAVNTGATDAAVGNSQDCLLKPDILSSVTVTELPR